MSMSPDDVLTHSGDTDYSDFEFQSGNASIVTTQNDPGEVRPKWIADFEVLQAQGGLSNDEVAELVYAEFFVDVEFETTEGQQDTESNYEIRWMFGADLDEANFADSDKRRITEGEEGDEIIGAGEGVRVEQEDQSSPEVFQLGRTSGSMTRSDDGGGGDINPQHVEKNYRELFGRGPVLDSADNLSIGQVWVVDDLLTNANTNITYHLVWDVASVGDAGRRFSIPDA